MMENFLSVGIGRCTHYAPRRFWSTCEKMQKHVRKNAIVFCGGWKRTDSQRWRVRVVTVNIKSSLLLGAKRENIGDQNRCKNGIYSFRTELNRRFES